MSVIFNESVENPSIEKNKNNSENKYFGNIIFYALKN
jgi:hypothetical protein